MPPFGSRKTATPPPEPPPPQAVEPSATGRLNALLIEQSEINATLDQHRAKRAELLHEDGELDLDAIRALQTEDEALRLRLEQLALRIPDIERELALERREEFERVWQTQHWPALAEAEADLTEAIVAFFVALERANAAHTRARNFGDRLLEFATPPPPAPVYNDWSLRQYLAVAERRQLQLPGAAPGSTLELVVEAPLHIPPDQRFAPRRVSVAQIESISAIAEPQRIRILHGPVRTSNLQVGIARMFVGEVHVLPARAAYALVNSGCAEYAVDETAAA